MFPTAYLAASFLKSSHNPQPVILPEKLAILLCGLLIAVFAIPLLIVIHAMAALFWGTITIVQLLSGKGLFDEKNEL